MDQIIEVFKSRSDPLAQYTPIKLGPYIINIIANNFWRKYWRKFSHYGWRRSGVIIVNFEHTSRLVLVFLMLTLNM